MAESQDTVIIEGNHYFPTESLYHNFFRPTDRTSVCSWKGAARYYDLVVNGKTNRAAAWYYPDPEPAASLVKGRLAFWKGVKIQE